MSKRVFIDTNIMLDFLGERHPHYKSIAQIASLADANKLTLVVSPISYATVSYFLGKYEKSSVVNTKLRKFKVISEVSVTHEQTVEKSLNSKFKDFEDALQYYSALEANCDLILTRNGKDFRLSEIPVMTAEEFLASVSKDSLN